MINNSASVFGNGLNAAVVNNSAEVLTSTDGISHFHFISRLLLSAVVVFRARVCINVILNPQQTGVPYHHNVSTMHLLLTNTEL